MIKLKVYCVTNKRLASLERLPSNYKLVGVGDSIFSKKYIIPNNLDNIYYKEKYYSELTFHYWFWKNILDKKDKNWIGFCQKRRFWLNNETLDTNISYKNYQNFILKKPSNKWNGYDSIICEPIFVNKVKKIKIIKRGFRSLLKDPSIFFLENKQSIKFHFDMHHGYCTLDKAINLLDKSDKEEFRFFVNNQTYFNPHIMFISSNKIADEWFKSLFTWLHKCEDIFGFNDLVGYDKKRLYAFLGERYLSFWFNKYTKSLNWPWALIS